MKATHRMIERMADLSVFLRDMAKSGDIKDRHIEHVLKEARILEEEYTAQCEAHASRPLTYHEYCDECKTHTLHRDGYCVPCQED